MNKEIECEIVKDLSILYLEGVLNQKSKEFIEEHLNNCNDCKKFYENIKLEMSKDVINNYNNDNIVVNEFKKVNKHISILKLSLLSILIFIFVIVLIFYMKSQKISTITNNAYQTIIYMKNLDNYKLSVKTIQKNLKTNDNIEFEENYYYKDGKYKIESNDSIKFYEDNSYKKICVYNYSNRIFYYDQDFIEFEKGRIIDTFSEIINYNTLINRSNLYSLILSIREDVFNNSEFYVIRFGNSSGYRDVWIDKNNYITKRIVNEEYNNFYREEIYTFTENIVTQEDVDSTILNSDKYKNYKKETIVNNATNEIKLYEQIYKVN